MNKVRFGVIGCGYIARKAFLPAIKKSETAELIAVASRSKKKALEKVNKMLVKLDADERIISISLRQFKLVPHPPPGTDQIVVSRDI